MQNGGSHVKSIFHIPFEDHGTSFPMANIFASSSRAHERVHVQNVREFPQTKLDSEKNSLLLLNEHGDPDFFSKYLLRTV